MDNQANEKKKNKRIKQLAIALGIVTIVFGSATYVIGDMIYQETVGWVNPAYQNTGIYEVYKDSPEVIAEYEQYKVENVMIPSKNGYAVEAQYIYSKNPTNQTVVIVHGIGTNMYRHLREALMYVRNDFNVVIYNQRYTGQTGGDNRSFGYYEQDDLAAVVNDIHTKYPEHTIGAHGFSMGAATVGTYSGQDLANEQLDYMILDCPFDTMEGAVATGVAAEGIPLPLGYLVWSGDVYNTIKSGFKYEDAQPIEGVANSTMPLYIIHGEEDTTCPVEMGQAIYDAKTEGEKALWIQPGVEHVRIFDDYPEIYEENVMTFIESIQNK